MQFWGVGGRVGLTRCNIVYVKMVNSTPLETKQKHNILSDSFPLSSKHFMNVYYVTAISKVQDT